MSSTGSAEEGATRAAEVVLAFLALANMVSVKILLGVGGGQLVMAPWLLLAIAGLLGVVMDSAGRSPHWGLLTWGSAVELIVVTVAGWFLAWPFVLPTLLALSVAAILADRRRGRSGPLNTVLAAAVGLVDLVALAFLPTVVAQLAGG